jgi:hypothetical protein
MLCAISSGCLQSIGARRLNAGWEDETNGTDKRHRSCGADLGAWETAAQAPWALVAGADFVRATALLLPTGLADC